MTSSEIWIRICVRSAVCPNSLSKISLAYLLAFPCLLSLVYFLCFPQTMETGTITEWLVKEGEAFSAGDIICMVETDKVSGICPSLEK